MVGPYKRSKFLAEQAVRRHGRASAGLPAVIVNPSTPIGPRDVKPTPTGRMIVDAASGRMPAYVDTGLNFVHVDDVAAGHLLAFEQGRIGERYILGGEDLTLAQILRRSPRWSAASRHLSNCRAPPSIPWRWSASLPPASPAANRWQRSTGCAWRNGRWSNSAKAECDLGYRHRPADQALADAVRWFAEAGYLK